MNPVPITNAHPSHDAGRRIVVMFDEDDAGREGREKAVARLSLHCFVRTHRFAAEDQQPDSLTAEQLQELRAS